MEGSVSYSIIDQALTFHAQDKGSLVGITFVADVSGWQSKSDNKNIHNEENDNIIDGILRGSGRMRQPFQSRRT